MSRLPITHAHDDEIVVICVLRGHDLGVRAWIPAQKLASGADVPLMDIVDDLRDDGTSHVTFFARTIVSDGTIACVRVEGDEWRQAEDAGVDLSSRLVPLLAHSALIVANEAAAPLVVERDNEGKLVKAWLAADAVHQQQLMGEVVDAGRKREVFDLSLESHTTVDWPQLRGVQGDWVAAIGTPEDGYRFEGPFLSAECATTAMEGSKDPWEVMELVNPIAQALRPEGDTELQGDAVTQCIDTYRQEFEAWAREEAHRLREMNDRCETAGAIESEAIGKLIIEAVEEIKSELGARAANAVRDDEQAQEDAISRAEQWVSDNLADSAGPEVVLWVRGLAQGEEAINRALAPRQVPRGG